MTFPSPSNSNPTLVPSHSLSARVSSNSNSLSGVQRATLAFQSYSGPKKSLYSAPRRGSPADLIVPPLVRGSAGVADCPEDAAYRGLDWEVLKNIGHGLSLSALPPPFGSEVVVVVPLVLGLILYDQTIRRQNAPIRFRAQRLGGLDR